MPVVAARVSGQMAGHRRPLTRRRGAQCTASAAAAGGGRVVGARVGQWQIGTSAHRPRTTSFGRVVDCDAGHFRRALPAGSTRGGRRTTTLLPSSMVFGAPRSLVGTPTTHYTHGAHTHTHTRASCPLGSRVRQFYFFFFPPSLLYLSAFHHYDASHSLVSRARAPASLTRPVPSGVHNVCYARILPFSIFTIIHFLFSNDSGRLFLVFSIHHIFFASFSPSSIKLFSPRPRRHRSPFLTRSEESSSIIRQVSRAGKKRTVSAAVAHQGQYILLCCDIIVVHNG